MLVVEVYVQIAFHRMPELSTDNGTNLLVYPVNVVLRLNSETAAAGDL